MLEHFTAFLTRYEDLSEMEDIRLEMLSAVLGVLHAPFAALDQLGSLPQALQASETKI